MITLNSAHIQYAPDTFVSDKARFEWQMDKRANYVLIGDNQPHVEVCTYQGAFVSSKFNWLNKGELIAGSFLSKLSWSMSPEKNHHDIDIYFKCKEDAIEFCRMNPDLVQLQWAQTVADAKVAIVLGYKKEIINLIFGIEYSSPADLISHFDIRACSLAYDPVNATLYEVQGAFDDIARNRLVYNPVPHNTTVARLIKYVEKGYSVDPYQRLFLAEFLKSDQYNQDLEISTGYRAVNK